MAIKVVMPTHESYVEALCQAADEIKLRADEMIGEVNGVRQVSISLSINPHEITDIEITKTFISGFLMTMKERDNNG